MLESLVAALFPLVCPGCGRPAEPVCDACARGLRAPAPASLPIGVDAWIAPFAYEGVARELIARAKYRGSHAVNAWLATAMTAVLEPPLPTVVTWVPTTLERRRARGFDHAELLARHVARRLSRPTARLLTRRSGPAQTGLTAADRRRGPDIQPWRAAPPNVLVVDDVATTGASVAAAAAALRAGGARRVVAVTAARTPARTR